MRSSVAKSLKKSSARHSSVSSPSRKRVTAGKSTRLKPATKRSPPGKARARKATKAQTAKQKPRGASRTQKAVPKKASPKTTKASKPARSIARAKRPTPRATERRRSAVIVAPVKPAVPPPRPTYDEAAALKAFEAAHREFTRGRFAEARSQFRSLVEKYPSVAEVTARARTYLSISEARLRTELSSPRDADSLYDRGVIELNRGEYVAAQELFERALKREPDAAHIHYGLAATRARLGAIDTALKSLKRALDLQPKLRIRAQRDHDLNPLRSDPEFDTLVFARE
jgi:tetratricopeptide (TPR) repeat protein